MINTPLPTSSPSSTSLHETPTCPIWQSFKSSTFKSIRPQFLEATVMIITPKCSILEDLFELANSRVILRQISSRLYKIYTEGINQIVSRTYDLLPYRDSSLLGLQVLSFFLEKGSDQSVDVITITMVNNQIVPIFQEICLFLIYEIRSSICQLPRSTSSTSLLGSHIEMKPPTSLAQLQI